MTGVQTCALPISATIHELKVESFKGDIIANPYMFASPTQELASKISVLLNYFKLFFLPSPLLADYSYDTIPYATFQSVSVWISLFLFFGLFLSAIFLVLKRSKGSFPLILILGFFIPVSNIFIDLGAVMGERLFFHA